MSLNEIPKLDDVSVYLLDKPFIRSFQVRTLSGMVSKNLTKVKLEEWLAGPGKINVKAAYILLLLYMAKDLQKAYNELCQNQRYVMDKVSKFYKITDFPGSAFPGVTIREGDKVYEDVFFKVENSLKHGLNVIEDILRAVGLTSLAMATSEEVFPNQLSNEDSSSEPE